MAVLAHVLQLVGGWIAPLVIFFMKRQSRFITFHALQVLLFQGVCFVLEMLAAGSIFIAIGLGASFSGWTTQHGTPVAPWPFFLFFGIFWLGFMVSGYSSFCLLLCTGSRLVVESGQNIRCSGGAQPSTATRLPQQLSESPKATRGLSALPDASSRPEKLPHPSPAKLQRTRENATNCGEHSRGLAKRSST